MRRQHRGVEALELVASLRVAGERVVEEAGQPRARADFAGAPSRGEAAGPVRRVWGQSQRLNAHAFRGAGGPIGYSQPTRGSGRRRERTRRAQAAPEGGENAHRRAGFAVCLPGFAQQLSIEAVGRDAARFKLGFDARVEFDLRRAVAPSPNDFSRARRFGERKHRCIGASAQDVEPSADGFDFPGEGSQRLRQPPATRAAKPAQPRAFLVEDINEQSRMIRRGGYRRLIVKPEVFAQPNKRRHAAIARTGPRPVKSNGRSDERRTERKGLRRPANRS